jgi:hypothetical protein
MLVVNSCVVRNEKKNAGGINAKKWKLKKIE